MATQPPPPSRTASVGPPSAGGMNAPPAQGGGAQGANSQQNLNQIDTRCWWGQTEGMYRAHDEELLAKLSSRVPRLPTEAHISSAITAGRAGPINPSFASLRPPYQVDMMQRKSTNLTPQVLEYLSKKGYSRTEAMLRKESTQTDQNGNVLPNLPVDDLGGKKYGAAFDITQQWIDNVLDIYKPELKRLLWPLFVYCFLQCVAEFFSRDGQDFFKRFRDQFEAEHEDDLRALSAIYEPEHVQENEIAKLYRNNKYRVTLSSMAFQTLVAHLEAQESNGGKIITNILQQQMDIKSVDRASLGAERSLTKLLAQREGNLDVPAEDEGIPGHNPGSANLDSKATAGTLVKLSLGPLPMESDLMEDVKAELQDHDVTNPPGPGQNSLIDEFEESIKREPLDEVPSREALPFPPSTARDVAMEVQKIRENRDRYRIEGRTGGVGPGVSVTMFTFHNTFDCVNCIEFSGDNTLAAVGTAESYIRVWSLDNRPLVSPADPPSYQPSASRRLIGHSGPVYALSFSPSIALPELTTNGHTENGASSASQPRYLLSCSADATIRLWSLDTWTNLVIYRSHQMPVWDVRFSPHGHYFTSCSADRTARLWSTPQIAPLRLFVGHDSDVETVAWHPNNAYVFTGAGGGDRTVRMWDVQRGTAVRMFTGHTGNVTALACAQNGKALASADDRGEIILWDIASGRLVKRMRGHGRGGIWSLDWSVESTVLVSGGADGTVRVWDVASNKDGQGKIVGEGGTGLKVDGTTIGAGTGKQTKTKKDVVVSPDQISAFPTKKSPVYKVHFTQMNLIVAGGAYLP